MAVGQLLLDLAAAGDVLDVDHVVGGPVPQRHLAAGEADPDAGSVGLSQPDRLTGAFQQLPRAGRGHQIVRMQQPAQRHAQQVLLPVADKRRKRAVDLQQAAALGIRTVQRDQQRPDGSIVERPAQQGLAVGQRLLGLDAVGDVAPGSDDLVVVEPGGADVEVAIAAVKAWHAESIDDEIARPVEQPLVLRSSALWARFGHRPDSRVPTRGVPGRSFT